MHMACGIPGLHRRQVLSQRGRTWNLGGLVTIIGTANQIILGSAGGEGNDGSKKDDVFHRGLRLAGFATDCQSKIRKEFGTCSKKKDLRLPSASIP
jgi:hypothetical protein